MKKHFGVVYLKDGSISLTRGKDTRDEVLKVLNDSLAVPELKEKVERTTIIVREVDESDPSWKYIFGCPASLDLINGTPAIKKEKIKEEVKNDHTENTEGDKSKS